MSSTRQVEAIVTRLTQYGESDLIVHAVSPELGLFSGIARAGRKSVKRFGRSLEAMRRLEIRYSQGRGADLLLIESASDIEEFPDIPSDMTCYGTALFLLELAEHLCVYDDEASEIYAVLHAGLRRCNRPPVSEVTRIVLALKLLGAAGFKPLLEHCVATGITPGEGEALFFSPRAGGLISQSARTSIIDARPISNELRTWLLDVANVPIAELGKLRTPKALLPHIAAILDALIKEHVSIPLRSEAFLKTLRMQEESPL